MQLIPGNEAEYKRRHDAIWPELSQLLKEAGISCYSIFLDETSGRLFGYMQLTADNRSAALPGEAIMQRWWKYMADLMITHPDHAPVVTELPEVFYLP